VLLVIAVTDILRTGLRRIGIGATIGAVPLGTPLIAGPATLTTAMILVGTQGFMPVILSVIVNILFTWIVFLHADRIVKIMGISGSKAVAKVAALILAAIGIRMIRLGLTGIITAP
jgi:multiple antibiotic resistance protein